MSEIIIDGKGITMGRIASYAIKKALMGEKVAILNSNEVIISGNKKEVIEKFKRRVQIGGHGLKGPKIIRTPERILKRGIRGMVDHKKGRGNDALKKIKCYNEIPREYEGKELANLEKKKYEKFITLKELVEKIK